MSDNKEILSQLNSLLSGGYSSYDIFNDFLDLILYALMNDNESYLKIVHKYPNTKPLGHREIDYFHTAFQLLQYEMRETNSDVLGELYMQWNMNNKYKGQFFTPKHIASFMAQITNPARGRILDQACGSGVMLVESIKTMTHEQLDDAVFYGQDIDMTCVKMTALNLCFFNVNGYAVQGNTLLMECNKVYQTKRSIFGGSIRELTGEELERFKKSYITAMEMTVVKQSNLSEFTEQLTLF
jgi:type I restriction-modification system DNA methylase subunit